MKFQSQKTDGYLGNTKWTIRAYGCLTASFATILEVDIHAIAAHAEYYNSDGLLVNPQKLCDDFSGEWNASRADIGLRPVIVETRFDGSLHFIVWDGSRFWDPLSINGTPLRDYKMISYRNVKKKEDKVAGQLYNNSAGQVWMSFDNKKFYVEDPNSIAGEPIINGDAPGEIMIKQSDQDARLAEQAIGFNKQIENLKSELIMCEDTVDIVTKEKQVAVEKLCKVTTDLKTCKTSGGVIVEPPVGIWERFVAWIKKLFK